MTSLIIARGLELRLEMVGLNQALLHLLLEILEAVCLALIDALIGSLHLARTELLDGKLVVRMHICVLQAIINVL